MNRPILIALVLLAPSAMALSIGASKPATAVPSLKREPALDGKLGELKGGALAEGAGLKARAATYRDTLFLEVELKAEEIPSTAELVVTLHFPGAGTTALGYFYRLGQQGVLPPHPEMGPPPFANQLVQSRWVQTPGAVQVETAIPLRAFPRFPVALPMEGDLCISYATSAGATVTTGCVPHRAKLRDEVRKDITPPKELRVVGVEGRAGGWVGFNALHYPAWIRGDQPLTEASLVALVSTQPVDFNTARIPVPAHMVLPDGRKVFAVLSGKDPYTQEDACDRGAELRIALFAVHGPHGQRVLEWPAANCALGRAASIVLDDEGGLSIGYSNGSSSTFIWGGQRFERTELGKR